MYGADLTAEKVTRPAASDALSKAAMCLRDRPSQVALWVGNEFVGLSELAIAEADLQLFIPMRGMIQVGDFNPNPRP